MKGRTGSTFSRTKYDASEVETSCYRLVPRLKFIVTSGITVRSSGQWFCPMSNKNAGLYLQDLQSICSEFKRIELYWNRIVHQNALAVWSSLQPDHDTRWTNLRAGCKTALQPRNDDRSPIWKQKHLKTSDIFSLPRISKKDFPYIKGKIDWSIGINYSSVNFKWTQVFLCCQSFDRRDQNFLKYRSYRISLKWPML